MIKKYAPVLIQTKTEDCVSPDSNSYSCILIEQVFSYINTTKIMPFPHVLYWIFSMYSLYCLYLIIRLLYTTISDVQPTCKTSSSKKQTVSSYDFCLYIGPFAIFI